ncbi:MAG: lipoprotein signal peptidase [Fimbriimonadales bacterium]|nr:MAG: lipoprotein signal peptidase [Fimbriimonadales bacterium]
MFGRVAITVFVLDQLTKFWATASLHVDQSLPVLPPYFYLTLTHNTGIAFGMLEGRGWLTIPLTLAVASGLIWYNWRHKPTRSVQTLTGLLLGGALGNFVDRVRLGYVVDMFDCVVWPVFNVADMAITSSLVGLMALQFWGARDAERVRATEEPPR